MVLLSYTRALQSYASLRVSMCKLTQIPWTSRFRPGAYAAGEIMYVSSVKLNWSEVIDKLEEEKKDYRYNDTRNNVTLVGNYSQIISSRSTTAGCAANQCGTQYFYVCFFAPGMKEEDVIIPYVESASGKSCDMCPKNCTNSSCDCSGVTCLNGATLNVTTCKCDCLQTVDSYSGNVCELECNEHGDDPACGSTPYGIVNCTVNPEVMFHCPWMCSLCPYSGKGYIPGSERMPWEVGLPDCDQTTIYQSTTNAFTDPDKASVGDFTGSAISTDVSNTTKSTTAHGNSSLNENNYKEGSGLRANRTRCKWKRKNRGSLYQL